MSAIDVYAATNPAFGALVLHAFAMGHTGHPEARPPEFPRFFLVLPLLLSAKGLSSFDGTNVQTGFFGWLDRRPEITVSLAANVRAGIQYTRAALRFAVRHRLVQASGYHFAALDRPPWRNPPWTVTDERGQIIRCSRRFGTWLSHVPDTVTVFHSLGIAP